MFFPTWVEKTKPAEFLCGEPGSRIMLFLHSQQEFPSMCCCFDLCGHSFQYKSCTTMFRMRQLANLPDIGGGGRGEGGRHGLKSGCSSRKQQAAMLQMAGSSGFEDILALVAARPPAVASPSFVVVGDDVDGIEELQILAAAQPRQTHGVFGFRTKASTSHARGCKRGLRLVLQLGSEKVRSKRLEAGLAIVGKMHPTICKALCLPTSSSMVSQDQMSAVYLRVAASSKI